MSLQKIFFHHLRKLLHGLYSNQLNLTIHTHTETRQQNSVIHIINQKLLKRSQRKKRHQRNQRMRKKRKKQQAKRIKRLHNNNLKHQLQLKMPRRFLKFRRLKILLFNHHGHLSESHHMMIQKMLDGFHLNYVVLIFHLKLVKEKIRNKSQKKSKEKAKNKRNKKPQPHQKKNHNQKLLFNNQKRWFNHKKNQSKVHGVI